MSAKAKAIKTLYLATRITIYGVREAVVSGVITKEEYAEITGKAYN